MNRKYDRSSAPRLVQLQMKLAFYNIQCQQINDVLDEWGKLQGSQKNRKETWAISFCVLLLMILVMDKIILAAYDKCEHTIRLAGQELPAERQEFNLLVDLIETKLFKRCKEIFHGRYKTRNINKADGCNPLRDGVAAWRSKKEQVDFASPSTTDDMAVDSSTLRLCREIEGVMRNFGIFRYAPSITNHSTSRPLLERGADEDPRENGYSNLGRLARVFLSDFLT